MNAAKGEIETLKKDEGMSAQSASSGAVAFEEQEREQEQERKQHPLERDVAAGMNPTNLLTGLYGPRGERIRHVVHEGSLRLPADALAILLLADEDSGKNSREDGAAFTSAREASPSFVLPCLDSVMRPSVDPDLSALVVTDVVSVPVVVENPPPPQDSSLANPALAPVTTTVFRTAAKNRTVTFPAAALDPERIRGGGSEEEQQRWEAPSDRQRLLPPHRNEGDGQTQGTQAQQWAPAKPEGTNASSEPEPSSSAVPQVQQQPVAPSSLSVSLGPTSGSVAATASLLGTAPTPSSIRTTVPPSSSSAPTSLDTAAMEPQPRPQSLPPATIVTKTTTVPSTGVSPPSSSPFAPPSSSAIPAAPSVPPVLLAPSSEMAPPYSSSSLAVAASAEAVPGSTQRQPSQPQPAQIPAALLASPAVHGQLRQAAPVGAADPMRLSAAVTAPSPLSLPRSSSAAAGSTGATAAGAAASAIPVPLPASTVTVANITSASSSSMGPPAPVGAVRLPVIATVTPAPPQVASLGKAPGGGRSSPGPDSTVPSAVMNPRRTASSGTAAAPTAVSSSSQQQSQQPAPSQPPEPKVIPLKERPNEQWEQHVPDPNDEAPVVDPANRTPRPDWYSPGGVSDLELTALHEWFDGSAPHRTPEAYVAAREKVLAMAGKLGTRYLTSTMVRRAVPGDVSSLTRLHGFLMAHSLINEDSQNESAPTPAYLLDDKARAAPISWDDDMKDELLVAVVDQSRKSSKRARLSNPTVAAAGAASSAPAALSIDWEEVSQHVGRGVTARDCEREFLALRIVSGSGATAGASTPADRPITPDSSVVSSGDANLNPAVVGEIKSSVTGVTTTTKPSQYDFLQEILDGCDPDLACAVAATALELSAGSLDQAQKAGRAGLLLARAVEAAQAREESVAHLLSEIVDLRMKKLENRLSLLDDVEGMLEAERVALELERRDLYTARCRHWFGGA